MSEQLSDADISIYQKECKKRGMKVTDLKGKPFNSIDDSPHPSSPNAEFIGKATKNKAAKAAEDEGTILIKKSLLKKIVEKLKTIEAIEDMTDINDVKELLKD